MVAPMAFRVSCSVVALTSVVLSVFLSAGCSRDPGGSGGPVAAPSVDPATASGKDVAVGRPAPNFHAQAHDGAAIDIAALKGKPVVLYFYPRDETPGCTKEACAFRDAWNDLSQTGVVLVGISTDDLASHKKFAEHHELPFHLVSDPDGAIAKAYGVGSMAGFLARQTVLIGADGNIKKLYRSVDPKTHAAEILADLKS